MIAPEAVTACIAAAWPAAHISNTSQLYTQTQAHLGACMSGLVLLSLKTFDFFHI